MFGQIKKARCIMQLKCILIPIVSNLFSVMLLVLSGPTYAAPGEVSQIPLFVAPPTPPNIFFMLDDSGSMHWTMPSDGVQSQNLISLTEYDTVPDNDKEWQSWCPGTNLMAYDPNTEYKPWAANIPNTSIAFPDMSNLSSVWVNPITQGVGSIRFKSGENNIVNGTNGGTINLSAAPVITWIDTNNNGQYDSGECPSDATGYSDSRVRRADSLSSTQQTNFANWFAYYRLREHATKAAVTQVIANSSARMGMATLHHNNNVGVEVKDMMNAANKTALLNDVININSSGGTPLRTRLNYVGQYFDTQSNTNSSLNIGSANSPILSAAEGGECQQNFVMLMTDGQWNGDSPNVGHQDKTVDSFMTYPAHKDTKINTLADVAMRWYKADLAPSLANKVPIQTGADILNLDENSDQHLVTFGVAFGPSGTVDSDPVNRNNAFSWPTPSSNSATTVDDLRHAAYNGRGQFLSASNPQTLITALQNVISDIESRQGSASAVSFNSTSLATDTTLFFASFNTTNWTGDLESFSLNPTTGDISTTSLWSAANLLDNKSKASIDNQAIYTLGTNSAGVRDGVLFNWGTSNPQILNTIQNDLKQNQNSSAENSPFTESQKRLNFLRGDTSDDGVNLMRSRSSRLGDIVHSSPAFVGSPISGWPDTGFFGTSGAPYSSYQASLQSAPRKAMVYVGANDGLLHGFDAGNGEQLLAYAPSATASTDFGSGLHHLTESNYNHRYYVDGQPITADVFIKSDATAAAAWKTILIGSLRGGGRGIYALDVTNPTQYQNTQSAAKNTLLWEFTDQDDTDLGYTFSEPEVTMMNNGQWAVILGNGYNSDSGVAKLMIVFIEQGVDGQWSAGDYIKLNTGIGSAVDKNGLSTPALFDANEDGVTDRIYAGDLKGNMWAFDVSDTSAANWGAANGSSPLFTTQASQAITMKPLVVKPASSWINENAANIPNVMVYFGSGQYVSSADAISNTQQSFYGVWDSGIAVPTSRLVQQSLRSGFAGNKRVLTTNEVSLDNISAAGDLGWFINLPESGERVIVDAFTLEGLVFFNTMTPSVVPCAAGGSSWLMAVDMKTGGNPEIVAFDSSGDGTLDSSDEVTDGSATTGLAGMAFDHGIASATAVISTKSGDTFGYTSGTNSTKPIKAPLPGSGVTTGGRRSWTQLFN